MIMKNPIIKLFIAINIFASNGWIPILLIKTLPYSIKKIFEGDLGLTFALILYINLLIINLYLMIKVLETKKLNNYETKA